MDEVLKKVAEAATPILVNVRRVFDDCTVAVWGVDKEQKCPAATKALKLSEELRTFYETTKDYDVA